MSGTFASASAAAKLVGSAPPPQGPAEGSVGGAPESAVAPSTREVACEPAPTYRGRRAPQTRSVGRSSMRQISGLSASGADVTKLPWSASMCTGSVLGLTHGSLWEIALSKASMIADSSAVSDLLQQIRPCLEEEAAALL